MAERRSVVRNGNGSGIVPARSLRPVTSVRVGDEVARSIRDSIMSGAYGGGGQKVSVAQIASTVGVSAMPVREALLSLAHEGLLDSTPTGGFRVARLDPQDLESVFLVEAFIATELAERAVPLIDARMIARLRSMNAQVVDRAAGGLDDEKTRARIEAINFTFHRTINKLVDAPRLHWFLRAATRYVPREIYIALPEWTHLTVAEHPGIIDALEARDVELVRERMREHVMHGGELLIENLRARGFWAPAYEDVLEATPGDF